MTSNILEFSLLVGLRFLNIFYYLQAESLDNLFILQKKAQNKFFCHRNQILLWKLKKMEKILRIKLLVK